MISDINDLFEIWNLEDGAIILEPQEDFNKGIIGVSEDKCHIIYSYQKLTESLAESYKNYEKDENKTIEDYIDEASEWIDYNTIRSISYFDKEYAPIIIYEV